MWEVDCRPYGRIRQIRFPGAETPVRLIHEEWANEIRKTIIRDLQKGVPERIAVSPYLPREALLEGWVERWMEHLEGLVEAGQRSPTYVRRLRDFANADKGAFRHLYGRSIYSIGYGDLEDLVALLRASGVSGTTLVHIMNSLRTCLRWAAKRSGQSYQAPEFPELRRSGHEPSTLTLEQQDAVLGAIRDDQRGAFLAMADLMIRPGEARAANVDDYDVRVRELRIVHAMKGEGLEAPRRDTKSRDRRLLIPTSRLAEWLETHVSAEARLRRTGPLFEFPASRGRDDRRWSGSTLRHVWERACEQVELKIGLYNGTKHTTATWLRQSGLSIDEIGLALGHSSGRGSSGVTELYARAPQHANANIVRVLDERTRG